METKILYKAKVKQGWIKYIKFYEFNVIDETKYYYVINLKIRHDND